MSTVSRLSAAKTYRRNYILGMINGASFGFSDGIASPYLVLSVFVNALGAPNLLVGLLPAIANGGWYLPQFLISHRIQQLPLKQSVYRGAAIVRSFCWVGMIASTFLIAHDANLLLLVFFILYSLNNLTAGLSGTPFMDIVAKTIPVDRRGAYFGGRDLWGAITGIAAGYFVSILLNPDIAPQFPLNFGVIFLFAGIAALVGLTAFSLVTEPSDKSSVKSITFLDQVHAARHLFRENAIYRSFLMARVVIAASDIATPFYAIYATRVLDIPLETIGIYIALSTIASLIANPIWSRASDKTGNRIVLLGAVTCLLTLPILSLLFGLLPSSPMLALPFGLVFLLNGIARPAANIAYPSYLLEIATPIDRPLYISFTNTVLGVATLVPIVGGTLLDLFGFRVLFLISMAISLAAWLLARGLVEPRSLAK